MCHGGELSPDDLGGLSSRLAALGLVLAQGYLLTLHLLHSDHHHVAVISDARQNR